MSLINQRQGPGYGADVPVSMPVAPKNRPLIPMYGFAYNQFGICHDLSHADIEAMVRARYAPYDPTSPHNRRGDADLDGQ